MVDRHRRTRLAWCLARRDWNLRTWRKIHWSDESRFLLHLNPIEHNWDMLGRRIQAREPPVQNIRQLEAALHREWQQLSQQDIRRLTGGMRRRVEAVIQARGGYTRY